mgnify:FL=1
MCKGILSKDNFVPKEHIQSVIDESDKQVFTVFGSCTVVVLKLPNGFTVVESSGCIDPANYSEEIGAEICMKRIESQVWKLEGYVGTNEFAAKEASNG